jgi:hypothetical protein
MPAELRRRARSGHPSLISTFVNCAQHGFASSAPPTSSPAAHGSSSTARPARSPRPPADPARERGVGRPAYSLHETAARGFRQVYVHEGRGGVPIVLVHGWPESKRLYWRVIAPLAGAGFEVIVPDLRGSAGDPRAELRAGFTEELARPPIPWR